MSRQKTTPVLKGSFQIYPKYSLPRTIMVFMAKVVQNVFLGNLGLGLLEEPKSSSKIVRTR